MDGVHENPADRGTRPRPTARRGGSGSPNAVPAEAEALKARDKIMEQDRVGGRWKH